MIHGDLHDGNWMVYQSGANYEITYIDWDSAHKSWFLIDLATVIFTAFATHKL